MDKIQALAKEIVALQPDVIFAHSTPVIAALQRESRTIPIVFVNASDPIGSGFVASLARPGGNITGLLLNEEGITGKWLAMLKEIAPHMKRAAFMSDPKIINLCCRLSHQLHCRWRSPCQRSAKCDFVEANPSCEGAQ